MIAPSPTCFAGANDEFEKQMVIANSKCSEFFALMSTDKAQALLAPAFEFQVGQAAAARQVLVACLWRP